VRATAENVPPSPAQHRIQQGPKDHGAGHVDPPARPVGRFTWEPNSAKSSTSSGAGWLNQQEKHGVSPDAALVTGASSGIGTTVADAAGGRGCDMVLVAQSVGTVPALAQRLRSEHGYLSRPRIGHDHATCGVGRRRRPVRRVDVLGGLIHEYHRAA
jgi:hypothetical protein